MSEFYQVHLGMGGGINNPEPIYGDEVFCSSCNSKAKILKKKRKTWTGFPDFPDEQHSCIELIVVCPKCKKEGTIDVDHYSECESDMEKYGYRGSNYGS